MRLSISNSKNKLIIGIILLNLLLIIVISESFYKWNNIPFFFGKNHEVLIAKSKLSNQPILFILGDSRAEAGIIAIFIDSATNYSAYNIGIDGVYRGYYNELIGNNLFPDKIIVAVSPYSIFNKFKVKKDNFLSKTRIIRKPYEFTEKYLSGIVNRNSHLHYGLLGITDVIKYGKVSEYYSPKGWHGYDRLGSDSYYTYKVNLEAYKSVIIEAYKNEEKINFGMNKFENLVLDMKKNNLSVIFIRIPTSKEIRKIENEKYPWFSGYIKRIVEENKFEYLEFNDFEYSNYQSDGSHLSRGSAKLFTKELIKHIK